MMMKRPKHKRFEYQPRYYNPTQDPDVKRRERFRLQSHTRRGKRPSMVRLALWLIAALVAYYLLLG